MSQESHDDDVATVQSPEPESELDAETGQVSHPQSESEVHPESKSETQPESESETQPESESETHPESEFNPATMPSPLEESAAPDVTVPSTAGVRAERRVRRGMSLFSRTWLVICAVLAPLLAAAYLWLFAPPFEDVNTAVQAATPSLEPNLQQLAEAAERMHQQTQQLAQVLVDSINQGQPEPAKNDTASNAPSETSLRKRRWQALRDSVEKLPLARGVILDKEGTILAVTGDLEADDAALKQLVDALLRDQPSPEALVAVKSSLSADDRRVMLWLPLLQLDPLALDNIRDSEKRWRGDATLLRQNFGSGIAQQLQQRRHLEISALAVVLTSLFALCLLWLVLTRPLRRSMAQMLNRASQRASGQDVDTSTLLLELAVLDDIFDLALKSAHRNARLDDDNAALHAQLGLLAEHCQLAAKGNLSTRVEVEDDSAHDLAMSINVLIESFEQRMLRVRSLGTAGNATKDSTEYSESTADLAERTQALSPIPQLLADIAARLRVFAETSAKGESVEAELQRLAEAVTTRARTARGYVLALQESIATLNAKPHNSDLISQLQQEFVGLTLDASLPSQVAALHDLDDESMRQRLELSELPRSVAESPE